MKESKKVGVVLDDGQTVVRDNIIVDTETFKGTSKNHFQSSLNQIPHLFFLYCNNFSKFFLKN